MHFSSFPFCLVLFVVGCEVVLNDTIVPSSSSPRHKNPVHIPNSVDGSHQNERRNWRLIGSEDKEQATEDTVEPATAATEACEISSVIDSSVAFGTATTAAAEPTTTAAEKRSLQGIVDTLINGVRSTLTSDGQSYRPSQQVSQFGPPINSNNKPAVQSTTTVLGGDLVHNVVSTVSEVAGNIKRSVLGTNNNSNRGLLDRVKETIGSALNYNNNRQEGGSLINAVRGQNRRRP